MSVVWKLKSFLTENRITPNALAEHLKGQLSKTAIYNLVQDKSPTGVHFATLNVLITALTEMTGQDVLLSDLLDYQKGSRLWEPYAGVLKLDAEPGIDED